MDVGAHAGFFSLAARSHYPHAAIHAYEPNPRILPCLSANTASADVHVFPEAVGGEGGHVTMVDEGPSDEARATPSDSASATIQQVRLETAVERLGGEVDLLKMDCEGAEFEILCPGPVWSRVRQIRMEYHLYEGGTLDTLKTTLSGLGYAIDLLRPHHAQAGILWATRTSR